jgi:hypothetical protein
MKDSFRRGGKSSATNLSLQGSLFQQEEFKSPPALSTPGIGTFGVPSQLQSNPMVSFCEQIEEMHETESVFDKESPKAKFVIGQ